MVIDPGRLETVREQFDGRRSFAVPDQKTGCRCTESTHHPKNILHSLLLFLALQVGCDLILMCCWFVNGVSRLWRERLHFGYGFGSIRSRAGNWSSFGCEDDGVGGGCGDSPESFRGEGETGRGDWFGCGFEFDDGRES
jgi:hypothetical protein